MKILHQGGIAVSDHSISSTEVTMRPKIIPGDSPRESYNTGGAKNERLSRRPQTSSLLLRIQPPGSRMEMT